MPREFRMIRATAVYRIDWSRGKVEKEEPIRRGCGHTEVIMWPELGRQ